MFCSGRGNESFSARTCYLVHYELRLCRLTPEPLFIVARGIALDQFNHFRDVQNRKRA